MGSVRGWLRVGVSFSSVGNESMAAGGIDEDFLETKPRTFGILVVLVGDARSVIQKHQ